MLNEVMQQQSFSIIIRNQLQVGNDIIPGRISLGDNFPNPFNSNTSISVHSDFNKNLYIYLTDIKGSLVKVLVDNKKSKGLKTIHWNGTNVLGIKVQSGIYFYTLETEGFKNTKKMLLLK